jgi:hypothetical protein
MPYLGRQVVTNLADFHVDNYASGGGFTAGSTTQLTLTVAGIDDEEALSIFFDGVHQHHNTYTIASSVVTFDTAIPTGTANVEIHYGKQPVASALAANTVDSEHYVNASIDTEHIATNQIDGTLTKDALIADYSDVTITAADLIMYGDATDSNNTKRDTVQGILDLAGGGKVVQLVKNLVTAYSSGSTTVPNDDTIPTNTEGINVGLDTAITPTSATNRLLIVATINISHNNATVDFVSSLFQDSGSSSIASGMGSGAGSQRSQQIIITHEMAAGTTSSTTFKVRAGSVTAGTISFNGDSGARKYGGAAQSSMLIWEIAT